jgi:hypothetical protein
MLAREGCLPDVQVWRADVRMRSEYCTTTGRLFLLGVRLVRVRKIYVVNDERRVAVMHPENTRIVHAVTTRDCKWLMFLLCVG